MIHLCECGHDKCIHRNNQRGYFKGSCSVKICDCRAFSDIEIDIPESERLVSIPEIRISDARIF